MHFEFKVRGKRIEIGTRPTPDERDGGGDAPGPSVTRRLRETVSGLRRRIGTQGSSSTPPGPRTGLEGLTGSNRSSQVNLPLRSNMHNPETSLRSSNSSDRQSRLDLRSPEGHSSTLLDPDRSRLLPPVLRRGRASSTSPSHSSDNSSRAGVDPLGYRTNLPGSDSSQLDVPLLDASDRHSHSSDNSSRVDFDPRGYRSNLPASDSSQLDVPLLEATQDAETSSRTSESSDTSSSVDSSRPLGASGAVGGVGSTAAATPVRPPVLPPGFDTFTAALKAACAHEFRLRGGEVLQQLVRVAASKGPVPPGLRRQLNEAGAQAVHATVRQHFKGQLKSGNKSYAKDHRTDDPVLAEKQARRIALTDESSRILNELRDRKAPLEDFLKEGVAACGELSALSVALARDLGLKANIWSFVANEKEDSVAGTDTSDEEAIAVATSHAYCLIGEVPSSEDEAVPIGKYDAYGNTNAPHLYAVDGWADICCPSPDYDDAFDRKMADWDRDGKQIQHTPVGFHDARWMSPTDDAWKRETTGSGFQKRKDTIPDRMYRPE